MNYISCEQRAVSGAFDGMIEATLEVYRDDLVMRRLGPFATAFVALAENAYLPNVSGGMVSIPLAQRGADNVAVLPVGINGRYESLYGDASVIQPTPSMQNKVVRRFIDAGKTEADAESFIQDAITEEMPFFIASRPRHDANIFMAYEIDQETRTRMYSRPLIVANMDTSRYIKEECGLMHGHEFRHVLDIQASAALPDDLVTEVAELELKAYRTESETSLALEDRGRVPRSGLPKTKHAHEVERMRKLYNTEEDPYAVCTELMRGLKLLGIFSPEYLDSLARLQAEAA